MQFKICIDNEIIGYSQLEGGDSPMGVAHGILYTTEAYRNRTYAIVTKPWLVRDTKS
ncbi:MAG: hypothetical protein ACFB2X_17490 [Rivularia sp. (in: cyanobacteria)]